KVLRGLSGVYARLNDVRIERHIEGDEIVDYIKGGAAEYGISQTHGNATTFDFPEMFRLSQAGLAGDIGLEYLVKTQAVSTVFDEDNYYEYDWKIGISLLDLGWNKFKYNMESRSVAGLKEDVTGATLQQKFNSVENLASFNDSLETIVDQFSNLNGYYNIYNPARAVINVDRYMWNNFYINGELSVNLIKDTKKRIAVAESKLLTITPRWEKKRFGAYFPLQVTRYGNFWIGGALRAGPLLIGTHNLLNAFSSKGKLGGGAYIALTLRPSEFMSDAQDKRLNCPSL
ncbi:MAG: hypothetical protein J7497_16025, partial [Chitinophagaceae bacterium]|nr:hypothetical protein [Chitinophagaceae bacterium]